MLQEVKTPVVRRNDLAFVKRDPLYATKDRGVSQLAIVAYNTFLLLRLSPARFTSLLSHAVTIDEPNMYFTITVCRVAQAPNENPYTNIIAPQPVSIISHVTIITLDFNFVDRTDKCRTRLKHLLSACCRLDCSLQWHTTEHYVCSLLLQVYSQFQRCRAI